MVDVATTPPTEGLPYVALGDSFAAGFGLTPTTGKPVAACGQAARDYPHRIAQALGLQLTDVTCAGADTTNLVSTPQKFGKQSAAPQSRALGAATRVVTITIGGNDLDFVDITRSCLAALPNGPILETQKHNCRASYVTNGHDALAKRVSDVVRVRLAKTFASIRKDAPNAHVFVVGYPAVMPDAENTPDGGCFIAPFSGTRSSFSIKNAFPYTDTDVIYLHSIEVDLDHAIQIAARHAGFIFTSLLAGTEAHTPCGATPWLNGINVDSQNSSFTLEPAALHPNELGVSFAANSVIPKIRAALRSSATSHSPVAAPGHTQSSPPMALWWYLALGILTAVLLAATVTVIRRRVRK
jgi:lysophospholipase L1-like esterase